MEQTVGSTLFYFSLRIFVQIRSMKLVVLVEVNPYLYHFSYVGLVSNV